MIDFDTVTLRLALAVLFGALVGFERQWRHKAAGIKTNALVAVGAAGFAVISNTFGPTNHNPAQIAAAVVSGIGFIGGGVILHRGMTVQGVTTAATLWANASMGLAIGLGQFKVGIGLVAAIVVVQFVMRRASSRITKLRGLGELASRVELRVECAPESLREVNQTWTDFAVTQKLVALHRGTHRGSESVRWHALFRIPPLVTVDLTPLEEKLVAMSGVTSVDVRHVGLDDEGW